MRSAVKAVICFATLNSAAIVAQAQVSAQTPATDAPPAAASTEARAPQPANGEYLLTDFGPTLTVAEVNATLEKAVAAIKAQGGGVLVIPPTVNINIPIQNDSQVMRPGNSQADNVTVTIVDRRAGYNNTLVPAIGQRTANSWAGTIIRRDLNFQGPGIQHWGDSEAVGIQNNIVHGTSSYLHPVAAAATKGPDSRIYLITERGIYVGQFLNYYVSSLSGEREIITVKSIGWDNDKKQYYCTADLTMDHQAGAYFSNKNMVPGLQINSWNNADNQTGGALVVENRQYANGDSFVYSGEYIYQGDVMTQMGDEGGIIFNAEPQQDPNPFEGVVQSVDPAHDAVVFAPGVSHAEKLASSRPLINLNPKKWITAGTVKIVGQDNWSGLQFTDPKIDAAAAVKDGIDLSKFRFQYTDSGKSKATITTWDGKPIRQFKFPYLGRAYPSLVSNGVNWLGGRIIASADAGWGPEIVGRYFAVSEPSESLYAADPTSGGGFFFNFPGKPVYRWYRILDYWKNADGSSGIKLSRSRWYASGTGAPNLYNDANYTWDGHERPLHYIIAPGSMLYDVSQGWKLTEGGDTGANDPRTIKVMDSSVRGTPLDFAPGDPIQLAIGADPAIPRPMRIRMFNQVPDNMLAPAIEIDNLGKVGAASGIQLGGSTRQLSDIANRKDGKPEYGDGLLLSAVTGDGIHFGADNTDAALLFEQPYGSAQAMKWKHDKGTTSLTVDPATGEMKILGSPLSVHKIEEVHGISATGEAANNLRGIDIPVPAGAKSISVKFTAAEPDSKYSLNVQPNWMTQDAVVAKTAVGFTVHFAAPAKDGSSFDWQLIR